MLTHLFGELIYRPLYNGLVLLVGVIPSHDVGIAVVILTILVRFVLFPLSRRAVAAQMAMKRVAPEVDKLKEKYKNKPEEQGKAIFALYKENNIHPFAGIVLVLLQLPIMIGIYLVFVSGGLPEIHLDSLYSFVSVPSDVNMDFLGVINLQARNIVLAVLAGVSQFVYTRLSMGPSAKSSPVEASLSGDMAKSFEIQARYMLPAMVVFIGVYLAAVAPLYWTTSNLFMIAQEYLSGRRFRGT